MRSSKASEKTNELVERASAMWKEETTLLGHKHTDDHDDLPTEGQMIGIG